MVVAKRDTHEELKNKLRALAEEFSWEEIDEALEEISDEDEEDEGEDD